MIRARCTNKSAIKSFQNPRGDGTLFSVDLTDESGEIRATGFSRECDRLYHVFEPGYVRFFSLLGPEIYDYFLHF